MHLIFAKKSPPIHTLFYSINLVQFPFVNHKVFEQRSCFFSELVPARRLTIKVKINARCVLQSLRNLHQGRTRIKMFWEEGQTRINE